MSSSQKNWIWFVGIVALIFGAGIYLVNSRRAELGKSFSYSVDEYRQVEPALIKYQEVEALFPNLGKLSALAFAADGPLVVGGEKGIHIFPMVGSRLSPHPVKVPGSGNPSCIAMDDEGAVFAGMHDHVEIFSKAGQRDAWPSPGEKAYLTSIAVDEDFVFVADAGSRCIWRYAKEGGEPLKIESDRKFYIPSPFFDLDLGTDGSLWVVNPGYHAFENYRTDGQLISSWERSSFSIEGFSGCCNPAHFALMPDGSFVTAEKGLARVKIHNFDGSLRCVVAAPDQLEVPVADLAADDRGRVYVLCGDRIRVFEEKDQ
jgi:hypothetical protein